MNNKSKFYFKMIPQRLLEAHMLLDNIDRGLLIQIIRFHPEDCFLSVDYLTEVVLVCGEKTFYRSVYKLKMLGLIGFKRGDRKSRNRKQSNHYWFIDDPSLWRLPKNLAEQIKVDYKALGFGDLVFKDVGFPNELGFKIAFNANYPNHIIKRKKRSKSILTGTPVREQIEPNQLEWHNRHEILKSEHITPSRIVADFHKYKNEILKLKIPEHGLGEYEKNYFAALETAFLELSKNPPNKEVLSLIAFGVELENNSVSSLEISEAIRQEAKRLKRLTAED